MIIECKNVWRTFQLHSGSSLLRERLVNTLTRRTGQEFVALRDVSFSVEEGESLGIVGRNGAGKSTLLCLISGLAEPTRGSVTVNGRVAALLALGAGFHPDLTGRENLLLNAAMMGFSEKDARSRQDEIIDFSGIGEFIDEPLRTYSTGMGMRLAFSIAVNVDPEILIVDEVLAVGDQVFTAKCLKRIREIRNNGCTFICVSHSPTLIEELCDQGLWLDSGEVVMQGKIRDVMQAYKGGRIPTAGEQTG
jgi:ABC-type polysaccharide/polyol phosphate transport system ATPase subunit